jgi:hypothetical protein
VLEGRGKAFNVLRGIAPGKYKDYHMRLFRKLFLIIGIATSSNWVAAQEDDFGTWIEIGLEKQITKNFRLEFEEEIRIFKNFGELDRIATGLGGAYTFNKYLRAGAGYTWLYKNRVNRELWEHRHRFHLYLRGRYKIDRFTFTLRERLQSTFVDESIPGFGYNPRIYLRSRLQAAYNIKGSDFTPFTSAEMYYQLNNPKGNQIDNMRYTLGSGWAISKNFDIDAFLRLDQELNVKNPVSYWILGLSFNIGL